MGCPQNNRSPRNAHVRDEFTDQEMFAFFGPDRQAKPVKERHHKRAESTFVQQLGELGLIHNFGAYSNGKIR